MACKRESFNSATKNHRVNEIKRCVHYRNAIVVKWKDITIEPFKKTTESFQCNSIVASENSFNFYWNERRLFTLFDVLYWSVEKKYKWEILKVQLARFERISHLGLARFNTSLIIFTYECVCVCVCMQLFWLNCKLRFLCWQNWDILTETNFRFFLLDADIFKICEFIVIIWILRLTADPTYNVPKCALLFADRKHSLIWIFCIIKAN